MPPSTPPTGLKAPSTSPSTTTVRAVCPPAEAINRLAQASRRGKLPGFRAGPGDHEFRVRLMGEPFDRELEGRAESADAGATVAIRERVLLLWPAVAAVLCITAIWPGVWLTDSMLETYWPWLTRHVETWWWYIPLTAVPLPFALRTMWRKSAASAAEQRDKAMRAIRDALTA